MKIDKETQEKLQELQMAEQNSQNFSLQKQAFQLELNETESALEETRKASDEIYKITGQIMIKGNKEEILKELEERKNIFSLRIKSIEKQESLFREKTDKLRQEIEEELKKK
jgi:prefoldin beta subunit